MNDPNPYRMMWLQVCFDLPTNTAEERKRAANFRKQLLKDGFKMFQYSVYIRHCPSSKNAKVHKNRIQSFMPPEGKVSILQLTDRQFSRITVFNNREPQEPPENSRQLELF